MFENYIANHRRLVVIVLIVVTIIVIGWIYFILSSQAVNNNGDTDSNIDGSGENVTLPYSNYLYTIKYTPNSSEKGLTITAYSGYRNAAVNKLYELGLNPTNYKITFNYENPFKKYE